MKSSRSRVALPLVLLLALAACTPPAASPPATPAAAESGTVIAAEAAAGITGVSVQHHLEVLAHDSMKGRKTARPEIRAVARYIARVFEDAGLRPLDGDFIRPYPFARPRLDTAGARVSVPGAAELRWGEDFLLFGSHIAMARGPLHYLGTVRWGDSLPPGDLEGAVVLARVAPEHLSGVTFGLIIGLVESAVERGAVGTGVVLDLDIPPAMMRAAAEQFAEGTWTRPVLGLDRNGLDALLAGSPVDATTLLARQEPTRLDDVVIEIAAPAREGPVKEAPNVVAVLEGSDLMLRDEVVVLTAHFDHSGVAPPDPSGDSILNGADDNASGTVALLEVARAFATLRTRPARSVLFAAVSGEEDGILGSRALAARLAEGPRRIVAHLNTDMLGRNAPDSLHVIGQDLSTLGEVVRKMAADPRIGLNIMARETVDHALLRMSDQIAFLEHGVPSVFFHSGLHPDVHTRDDEADRLDVGKIARAARLVFRTAHQVAMDPEAPSWTKAGEARVQGIRRAAQERPWPSDSAYQQDLPRSSTSFPGPDSIQLWLEGTAVPMRALDPADDGFSDLEPLIEALGDARVVQLGEPSHGAGAAFRAKSRLIRFLHERVGFDAPRLSCAAAGAARWGAGQRHPRDLGRADDRAREDHPAAER